jgi:hypothetical protein
MDMFSLFFLYLLLYSLLFTLAAKQLTLYPFVAKRQTDPPC